MEPTTDTLNSGVYPLDERASFVTRTYLHLLGAMVLFVVTEVVLFQSGLAYTIAEALLSVNWLLVLGGFMVLGWLASHLARRTSSISVQYAGLFGYALIEAIIFVPLLFIAEYYSGGGVIQNAAMLTLIAFTGLTAIAWTERWNFSFLGGLLKWGGLLAILAIVAAVIFGFNLGTLFSLVMIAFAGAAILYDTSNILHHYPTNMHVSAALSLFSSVALMFWYILRLLTAFSGD